MNASGHEPTEPNRRYSWLGPGDRFRPRLVEVYDEGSRQPTLRCAGEFDASSCDELEAALEQLCRQEIDCLFLDFAEVEFLDGHAVGVLAATQLRLELRGVELRATVRGQPRRMFEISGLAESIELEAEGPAEDAA